MNKGEKISDKKVEKILSECINLIHQGYSIEYCENKFRKFRSKIVELLEIIESLKKQGQVDFSDDFLKNTLSKIYSDSGIQNNEYENIKSIKTKGSSFHYVLKPAIIFISVIIFFSLSFVGLLYASQNNLPGDSLYPVKRFIENIKIEITPKSKENILHYQLLNRRLYEVKSFLELRDNEKARIDNLIKEVEEEFDQCIKYNYYGDQTQDEVEDSIEKIKEQYIQEFNLEDNDKDTENENDNNSSGITEPDMEEESDTGSDYNNDSETDDDSATSDQEAEDNQDSYDSKKKDSQEPNDEEDSDEKTGNGSGAEDKDAKQDPD